MCERDNNGKCDKASTMEDYISKMVCHYNEIVTKIDLQKTNKNAGRLICTLLIVYAVIIGLIIFSILRGNLTAIENTATLITGIVTICVTIIVTLYQNGVLEVFKRDYETLETILFRLIDLEKDCKDDKLSCEINTLINHITNKMYFKKQ